MVVVNQSESSTPATAELGLHAVDGDALFLHLELLGQALLDHGLLQTAQLGVDQFDLLHAVRP